MKEVPKKDLPTVSGGTTSESPVPTTTYPQTPTVPGPTDQEDPFRDLY